MSDSDDNKRKHKHKNKKSKYSDESDIERNREIISTRSKQWKTVDSSDEDNADFDNDNNNISSSNLTTIINKRSNLDLDSDDSEDDSNSSDSENEKSNKNNKLKHRKDKKEKKEKKKHKSKHKHKKHKHDHSDKESSHKVNQSHYGKYGIIREENYHMKQREFEAYMTEVKGQPGILGQSKFEIMKAFKSYIEDYNTATLPHKKYYNYESWEIEDYKSKQSQSSKANDNTKEFDFLSDEREKQSEMKRLKEKNEKDAFSKIYSQMNYDKDKRESMKRQDTIKTEIQQAFKQGDNEKVRRLERLLAPDIPEPTVKHPWS